MMGRSGSEFARMMRRMSCLSSNPVRAAWSARGILNEQCMIRSREIHSLLPIGLVTAQQHRSLSSGRNYRESKKKNALSKLKILPRPPGEKEVETKFQMPDKNKEQELGRLQSHVLELHRSGQYQKALKAAQELLTDTTQHFTQIHPATAASYMNTGLMRKLLGDFDAARRDYVTAQEIYAQTVGKDHASYAAALHNLGNLNRTQIHVDPTLSATDRLSLVESALEYLQQAHAIRLVELGPEHAHTVASRSSWGATLAARILHHHKVTESSNSGTSSSSTRDLVQRRFYISLLPSSVTETAWEAAEEHLRQAYHTALDNPRGATVAQAQATKSSKSALSKQKKSPAVSPVDRTTPQTLSAAAAAQNLAVFLKARATTVQPYQPDWLAQAEALYRQVLVVQEVLLPDCANHPDRYVTLHSLAELLDLKGDAEAANALRQEMMDTMYDDDSTVTTPPSDGQVDMLNGSDHSAASNVPGQRSLNSVH
jgi:tetratricopeptide (TPR) repeat protein